MLSKNKLKIELILKKNGLKKLIIKYILTQLVSSQTTRYLSQQMGNEACVDVLNEPKNGLILQMAVI